MTVRISSLCDIIQPGSPQGGAGGGGGHWSTLARLLYVGIILINMRLEREEDTLQ